MGFIVKSNNIYCEDCKVPVKFDDTEDVFGFKCVVCDQTFQDKEQL
jgi:hypothetical protein